MYFIAVFYCRVWLLSAWDSSLGSFASIFGFLSNSFDLFPKYSQCGICADGFRQSLVSSDGNSQLRV